MEEEKEEIIKKKFRIITRFVVLTILSLLIIFIGNNKFNLEKKSTSERRYVKAKVIDVFANEEEETEVEEVVVRKDISFEAEIEEDKETKEVFGRQVIKNISEENIIKVNDKVILSKSQNSEIYNFVNYDRTNSLLILLGSILIISAIIGILKSFESTVTLLLSILIILLVYIPAIISGANIYLATSILTIYLLSVNLILVNGFNKRTFSIILSGIISFLVIGLILILLNNIFMISGYIFDDLDSIEPDENGFILDFKSIAWAGILISVLGIIVKTSLKIERSIDDMLEDNHKKDFKSIFKTGITEGRKLISNSMNSLGYAFIGTSLLYIISHMSEYKNYTYLINSEKIIILFILLFIGILSSLLVIPITSMIIGIIRVRKNKSEKKFTQKYSEGLSFDFKKKDK